MRKHRGESTDSKELSKRDFVKTVIELQRGCTEAAAERCGLQRAGIAGRSGTARWVEAR